MVAVLAVHGAAHWIDREAAREGRLLDPLVQFQGGIEGPLAGAVGDQLDRLEQAATADVADVAMVAETFGETRHQALAHGVPAVACDAGGVTELLGDGCGEVVPIGDPDALASAIAGLLSSPERRASLAQRGRERMEREFAVEPLVEQLRDLLGFGAGAEAADAQPAAARHADSSATGL